jgi:CPA2 family monovalent cation:H+ antiporter-2
MAHQPTLIATVAAAFVFAFIFGFAADRLRLPPLVGYLVAGILAGPYALGFVADADLSGQPAEMGVILLMFGVGLHFSVADLAAVRWIAIPGALGQIAIATLIGIGMTSLWGWSFGAGLVFGLALSVASTVVLLRALEEHNSLDTPNGRIAVGWLIVEDLAMVVALVLLPAVAAALGGKAAGETSTSALIVDLAITLGKVAAFVGIAVLIGPRVVPWILSQVARTGSRELFTLSVLALAMGIAFGSAEVFGVSFALGAFFAGVVLSESRFSHRAANDSLPLQDAFAVLFFVSVGMLFDPSILWREPLHVLFVVLLILVGKSIAAFLMVILLRFPLATAITVSASLAQIGEFSFILAGLGISFGLLEHHASDLILAGALISITLNPLAFGFAGWLVKQLTNRTDIPDGVKNFGAHSFELLRHDLQVVRERSEARETAMAIKQRELIDRFPILGAIEPEKREEFLLLFRPRTASPGDRIIRKGDRPDGAYFISSGQVQVAVAGQKIKLGPGDFFGEIALLSGERRTADVTAVDYCQLLMMTARDFQLFTQRNPVLHAELERFAAERSEMNRRLGTAEPVPLAAPPAKPVTGETGGP